MTLTPKYIAMSMPTYVESYLKFMETVTSQKEHDQIQRRKARSPFEGQITDSELLTDKRKIAYAKAVGMIGWMSETCRPDLKYSHSRLGAYLQFPTENACKMLIRTTCYAARKPHLGIRTPRWWVKEDPIYDPLPTNIEQQHAWRFYSDSDHAGNTETSNRRYKSHWGGLATLGSRRTSTVCSAIYGSCHGSP